MPHVPRWLSEPGTATQRPGRWNMCNRLTMCNREVSAFLFGFSEAFRRRPILDPRSDTPLDSRIESNFKRKFGTWIPVSERYFFWILAIQNTRFSRLVRLVRGALDAPDGGETMYIYKGQRGGPLLHSPFANRESSHWPGVLPCVY